VTRAIARPSRGGSRARVLSICLCLTSLLACGARASAAPRTGTASSLLEVAQVGTRVEPVSASLEDAGITREMLRLRLLSLLRDTAVPSFDAGKGEREHVLSLQATYVLNSGWHVVVLSLYLTRGATLAADPSTEITATVWSRSTIVLARKKKLVLEVERALAEQVREFAEDYRAANPR